MLDAPLISIVVCGRNDGYMGNYTWRITTALNCLARNLTQIGRTGQAEIILSDWNSPVPFHKELPLVREARGLVRFLVTPPEIAIPAQRDSKFPNPIAQNAAIRRSRGRFVAVTDADVILPATSLANLFSIVEGSVPISSPIDSTFLIAARRQVPIVRTLHNPPLPEIAGFIERNLALLKRDRLFEGLGAPAGLVVQSRTLWEEACGFDERLIHYGWTDIDLHLRISQKYPWLDLANFGVEAVHLEHYSSRQSNAARPGNGYAVSRRFAANDENWGMRDVALSMHAPEAVLDDAATARVAEASAKIRSAPTSFEAVVRELQEPEVAGLVAQIGSAFPQVPGATNLLRVLAWYAIKRHPRNYVELGVQRSLAPALVLAGCPTCAAYLVDQWSDDMTGGDPPIYQASNAAAMAQPQAQIQFITSDPATALDRLFGSIAPGLAVDLAVIRTDPLYGDPVRNALAVADHLAPGGAIAVSARTSEEFAGVWSALSARFPVSVKMQFKSPEGEVRTGFLLAVASGNPG